MNITAASSAEACVRASETASSADSTTAGDDTPRGYSSSTSSASSEVPDQQVGFWHHGVWHARPRNPQEEGSREWKGNNSVCKTGYKDRGNPPGCRTTSATYHRMVDRVGDFIEYGYKHRFHDPHARLTRTPWLQCAGRRLQADPPKRAAELAVVSDSSFDVSWWTHVAL